MTVMNDKGLLIIKGDNPEIFYNFINSCNHAVLRSKRPKKIEFNYFGIQFFVDFDHKPQGKEFIQTVKLILSEQKLDDRVRIIKNAEINGKPISFGWLLDEVRGIGTRLPLMIEIEDLDMIFDKL